MPQLLALEWDGTEVRLAAAALHGNRAVIEQAFSVSLEPPEPEGDQIEVGARIAAALGAQGIGRGDVLLSVGRASIELRQLSLPPAPDEELPEMVRFQAMREFNELDENWLLDFVPLDEQEDGPRNVLAAAVDSQLLDGIQATCQRAGLKPKRLILRPCAAASLFERARPEAATRLTLLVDLLSDEADLTVIDRGNVVFLRTTRLGGDPIEGGEQATALLGELRRTVAAAQNQLGGRRVEVIVLCGAGDKHAALARSVEDRLSLPTELFDPFDGLNLARRLRNRLPENPGRFASLLGMLLCELENRPHAIDFLHPRRRPKPPSRPYRYVIPVAVVLLLIAMFLVQGHIRKARLADEVDQLKTQSEQWDVAIGKAEKLYANVAEIEKWTTGDVVWLDELRELSREFPPAKEAVLTGLTVRSTRTGGEIKIEGLADGTSTLQVIERDLRDPAHRVDGKGSREDRSNKRYPWRFETSLSIEKEEK